MKAWMGTMVAGALLAPLGASADGAWDASGHVAIEGRHYWQGPRFPGQEKGLEASLVLQPEWRWHSDDDRQRIGIVAFVRSDSRDDERSHGDLREAYWATEGEDWDLTVGINKVFWGVAESRHLVDVINQSDLVEDLDQEDKLGQPMVNLNLQRDWGRLGMYLLPWFRERTFPGIDGRLRTPLAVDTDRPLYESSAKERHVDVALRYSHYVGDLDFAAYVFEGTSREPRFVPFANRLRPVYDQMTQLGVELQYTRDAWLWKFEGIARDTRSDRFTAVVAGFEYTFFGVRDSAVDVGILMEYLYDGRDATEPPTAFDDDVFFGARLAFNDVSDTSVLAGMVIDTNTGERFFNIEAERRIGHNLNAELRLRAFSGAEPGDALFTIERDDYLQLRLSWYY